ncbi:TetR/AcrR family transcriptional regulator [Neptunitalea lumnitzerae]|uniref:TetR family transcriptional regulator n=1 Tax=Neptunitalea lumnitzerae TaxID=2965509 RepID=A0ABQ5MNC5_9FLAO|nr:TetR family transcriptional regulator [Neptunitalea sp. Y10]GLB50908.1 TetR family transcriptional regulator [Neptunitalea sp. Y10]
MDLSDKQIQILEIAEKLFAEHGFDATSVRQIAKEADINIAMISYYFGSKEKLLETLLEYRNFDFRKEIAQIIEDTNLDHLHKIDTMIALLTQRIHSKRRIHKILHFEYSNGCRNINIDKHIQRKLKSYTLIEKFIKEGQSIGVFSKNVEIPLIVPTIIGSYFNFYYNKKMFMIIYHLKEEDIDDFVYNTLTNHIQKTIKALLTYEN